MGKFKKIIFLDEENTLLSPYAEAMARMRLTELRINEILVSSRGNVVLFPEPVNQKVSAIAQEKGLSLTYHKAVAIRSEDFSENTLVLSMDEENKARVYHNYTKALNVFTIKEYLGKSGSLKLPIGGTIEEYEAVLKELEELLESLIEKEINS